MQQYNEATFRSLGYPAIDLVYRRISDKRDAIGNSLNRRDRAEALIGICILEGVDTRRDILKVLGAAGLSKTFVGRILEERAGPLPGQHLWQADECGRFHLLDLDI